MKLKQDKLVCRGSWLIVWICLAISASFISSWGTPLSGIIFILLFILLFDGIISSCCYASKLSLVRSKLLSSGHFLTIQSGHKQLKQSHFIALVVWMVLLSSFMFALSLIIVIASVLLYVLLIISKAIIASSHRRIISIDIIDILSWWFIWLFVTWSLIVV